MSSLTPRFGLNHMVCPKLTIAEFLEVAHQLKSETVEFRNDVGSNSLTDLETARAAGARAKELGITVLSVNALYPFNVWNEEREQQARAMAELAQAAGALGLVVCPLNDGTMTEPSAERTEALHTALRGLKAILEEFDLMGFVEPLGFPISSLRSKREAIEAIDAIGGADRFKLVHDTFHHRGAGEDEYFPDRTGLIHISGLEDPEISFDDMLDSHRLLVGPADRLGNVEQLRTLLAAGYTGPVSFEPFCAAVWDLPDHVAAVNDSIRFVNESLAKG
ncbi:TIM barrel protein [Parathalassolituus penaei]|uniref:TIM barrel protein n=1 Tax=Parathalassolituus penaei TaxID=2997323 RepID=A0A9X3EB56_9GAMM|nr:TIM barrel protein [Parathalassolituus penaei]MCY0964319.1 TIM barrel protein [Parathalassolituus penaei]